MLRKALFLFLIVFHVSSIAMKCPKSRKPHPTNCTTFYNCINLPDGRYVWMPAKCSEGLVFESYLQMCVLPSETWTCDSLSQHTVIREKDPTDLMKSYLDFNSDPFNLSEIVDSSYSFDSTSNKEINQETAIADEKRDVTEVKLESSINDNINENENSLPFENKTLIISSVTWFGRIINNPLINQNMKTMYDETLLINSKYFIQKLLNEEDTRFNHFVTNYIMKNNFLNKQGSLHGEKLETTTSKIQINSTNNSHQWINRPEDTKNIIVVKNNLGNKHYLSIENYEFLKDQLNPESINIIPCSSGIRLPNNTDCTKYYICETKSPTLREFSCPAFTAFNEKEKICDTKTYSLCKITKKEKFISRLDLETENANFLKKNVCETVGKFADPISPPHYYLCYSNNVKTSNIQSIRMMCPNNLIFCAEKNICATKQFCSKKYSK